MVAPKSRRRELEPPDYVKKEWETGDKNQLAELFQRVNFQKELGLVDDVPILLVKCCTCFYLLIKYVAYCCPERTHCKIPGCEKLYLILLKNISKYIAPSDASMFEDQFFNELLIIIKRKKTVQLVVDEGWHSEEELKQLGWSATLS